MRNSIRSFSKNESGATFVEAAVVFPLYFALILGTLGWGLVMWQVNALQYAAERSARCSVLPTDTSDNRLCANWSNPSANGVDWIPTISVSSFSPNINTPAVSDPPSTSRSFQSTRTGTPETYDVNCITVTVSNPFLPGYARLPTLLKQSYCRPM